MAFAGEDRGAQVIPAHALSARLKNRLKRAALVAAPLLLLEACGGAPGVGYDQSHQIDDGGTDADDSGRVRADAAIADAGTDARGADASADARTDAPSDASADASSDAAGD